MLSVTEFEDALNERKFSTRGVQPTECRPIIHHHATPDDVTTPVHCTRHQRHLQQRGQLLLVLDRRLRVNETTLIADTAVRSHKRILCDRLAKHLHPESIHDYLLRLAIQVWMHERNVIVTRDNVTERRQSFLHALKVDGVAENCGCAVTLDLWLWQARASPYGCPH